MLYRKPGLIVGGFSKHKHCKRNIYNRKSQCNYVEYKIPNQIRIKRFYVDSVNFIYFFIKKNITSKDKKYFPNIYGYQMSIQCYLCVMLKIVQSANNLS